MNRSFSRFLVVAIAIAGVCGCESRDISDANAAASALPAPAGIAWLDDVEAGFAEAEAGNKPVFLFWGAEWCPYCADLKAHVFARRDRKSVV